MAIVPIRNLKTVKAPLPESYPPFDNGDWAKTSGDLSATISNTKIRSTMGWSTGSHSLVVTNSKVFKSNSVTNIFLKAYFACSGNFDAQGERASHYIRVQESDDQSTWTNFDSLSKSIGWGPTPYAGEYTKTVSRPSKKYFRLVVGMETAGANQHQASIEVREITFT